VEFNTLDATLLVILRLSNVVVANNTLSVILCIEEWEEHGQPEQVTGHEITGRRVQRWIHPRGKCNHDKGDDPRATDPCVDRAIDPFFGVCQEAAGLDSCEHQVIEAARKPRDEEAEDVATRTKWIKEVAAPNDWHEEEVVKKVVSGKPKTQHVVHVHGNNNCCWPVGACWKGEAYAH